MNDGITSCIPASPMMSCQRLTDLFFLYPEGPVFIFPAGLSYIRRYGFDGIDYSQVMAAHRIMFLAEGNNVPAPVIGLELYMRACFRLI